MGRAYGHCHTRNQCPFLALGWLHIDHQGRFYDRNAQPIAKEHALEHAGHLTLAVSEISQAQFIAKGTVGTDQGLSL
jgi:hypothetical protein